MAEREEPPAPQPRRKRTPAKKATPPKAGATKAGATKAAAKKVAAARPTPAAARARAHRAEPALPEPAAVVTAEAAEAQAPDRPPAPAGSRALPWLARGVTALVLVGLLVAVIVLSIAVSDDSSREDARRSAMAAARTYAADIATYDYRSLDKDFARVSAHSTGPFRAQFAKASKDLKPLIEKYHASAKGEVVKVGLAGVSDGRATAVVFVNQTVTNDNTKTPRVDRNRVTIDLVRRHGTWLISGVHLV